MQGAPAPLVSNAPMEASYRVDLDKLASLVKKTGSSGKESQVARTSS